MSSSAIGEGGGRPGGPPRWEAILRNYLTFGVTELLSKALSFVLMIYAARKLPVETFGDLSFALTILVLVATLADFGFSTLLIKRIAQDGTTRSGYMQVALAFKVGLTLFWTALALLYLRAGGSSPTVQVFVAVAGMASVVAAYAGVVSAALKALNKFRPDALLRLTYGLLYTAAGMVALSFHTGIIGLAVVAFLASGVQFLFAFMTNSRQQYFHFSRTAFTDWELFPKVVREALPFGVLALLGIVYFRIDMLMLQAMKGSAEVGLYAAGYKILEAILMIPLALSIVVLPVLSEALGKGNIDLARQTVHTMVKYMTYVSVPIATILTLEAERVIALLYPMPAYTGAVLGLRILAWTTVAVFISGATSTLIASSRSPGVNTWIASGMALLNVGLNVILIPRWGLAGAAVATVVTESSGTVMGTGYINRRMLTLRYESHLLRSCVAALAMAGVIHVLHSLAFVPLYLFVYGAVLLMLGGIPVTELRNARLLMTALISARESS